MTILEENTRAEEGSFSELLERQSFLENFSTFAHSTAAYLRHASPLHKALSGVSMVSAACELLYGIPPMESIPVSELPSLDFPDAEVPHEELTTHRLSCSEPQEDTEFCDWPKYHQLPRIQKKPLPSHITLVSAELMPGGEVYHDQFRQKLSDVRLFIQRACHGESPASPALPVPTTMFHVSPRTKVVADGADEVQQTLVHVLRSACHIRMAHASWTAGLQIAKHCFAACSGEDLRELLLSLVMMWTLTDANAALLKNLRGDLAKVPKNCHVRSLALHLTQTKETLMHTIVYAAEFLPEGLGVKGQSMHSAPAWDFKLPQSHKGSGGHAHRVRTNDRNELELIVEMTQSESDAYSAPSFGYAWDMHSQAATPKSSNVRLDLRTILPTFAVDRKGISEDAFIPLLGDTSALGQGQHGHDKKFDLMLPTDMQQLPGNINKRNRGKVCAHTRPHRCQG